MTEPEKDVPKYIIAADEYMGIPPRMFSVRRDSHRSLLLTLLDLEDVSTFDEPFLLGDREIKSPDDLTEADLQKWFDDANGDGQPYVMVFDVDADAPVLGVTPSIMQKITADVKSMSAEEIRAQLEEIRRQKYAEGSMPDAS